VGEDGAGGQRSGVDTRGDGANTVFRGVAPCEGRSAGGRIAFTPGRPAFTPPTLLSARSARSVRPMARWRPVVVVAGLWTLFGLWSVQQYLLLVFASGREVESWSRPFAVYLSGAWLWAAFTPLIVMLVRRFPLERQRVWLPLVAHAGLFVALSLVDTAFDTWWYAVLTDSDRRPFLPAAFGQSNTNLFSYAVVVVAAHALAYYRAYRERTIAAARLEAQLAQTQLHVLRARLHPHFLFNTLNAIAALMHRDVEAADRMLARLSELLRTAIDSSDLQEVSLADELAFVERYLEIERTRFSDRLDVRVDVASDAYGAAVPHLLLQPLVENAVRHGIAPRAGAGRIEVFARRRNGQVLLAVRDDGVGSRGREREGTGLGVTRERLRHLYGDAARIRSGDRAGGGFEVEIELPYRSAERTPRERT
jgi:signal transduction histidine kinase